MDTIEVLRNANVDSENNHEVLGCSTSADLDTLVKAYRDLSRKYHPDNNKALSDKFQKVAAAYATLVCHQTALDKGSGNTMGIPSTEKAAREAYEQSFGVYNRAYYGQAGMIGLPFAFSLRESLEASRHVLDRFSVRLGTVRVHLFRSWIIKWKLNPTLVVLETLFNWALLAICIQCWIPSDNTLPEFFSTITFDIVGAVLLLFAQFIRHFWYGFTRYPTVSEIGIGAWLNAEGYDKDLEEIRDVCSYYYHSDRGQRSQRSAMLVCMPFMVAENVWTLGLSGLYSLYCGSGNPSKTHVKLLRASGAIVSMLAHCSAWILFGRFGKLAVYASVLANRNAYNSILLRKGFGAFLQSLLFGENLAFTSVQPDTLEKKKKKIPAGLGDVESGTDGETDSHQSLDTIDIDGDASIWRRIDEASTRTHKTTSTRIIEEQQGGAPCNVFESVFGLTTLREEDSVCSNSRAPASIADLEAQNVLAQTRQKDDEKIRGLVIVNNDTKDSADYSAPSFSSGESSVAEGSSKRRIDEVKVEEKADLGGGEDDQSETSAMVRAKKKRLLKLYKSVKRRIEGEFWSNPKERGVGAVEPAPEDSEQKSCVDIEEAQEASQSPNRPTYADQTNYTMTTEGRGETLSHTTGGSSLSSMGREYEELVMSTSYIVSANPTLQEIPTGITSFGSAASVEANDNHVASSNQSETSGSIYEAPARNPDAASYSEYTGSTWTRDYSEGTWSYWMEYLRCKNN